MSQGAPRLLACVCVVPAQRKSLGGGERIGHEVQKYMAVPPKTPIAPSTGAQFSHVYSTA